MRRGALSSSPSQCLPLSEFAEPVCLRARQVELGGVIYVILVLLFLTIAIPLIQVTNVVVGVAFDVAVLVGATSARVNEISPEARRNLRSTAGSVAGQFMREGGVSIPKTLSRRRGGKNGAAAADAAEKIFKEAGASAPAPPPARLARRKGSSDLMPPTPPAPPAPPPPPAVLTRRGGSGDVQGDARNQTLDDLFSTAPTPAPTAGAFSGAFNYLLGRFRSRPLRGGAESPYDEVSTSTGDEDDDDEESNVETAHGVPRGNRNTTMNVV